MRWLLGGALALGVVLGACSDDCEDRPPGLIDVPVLPGTYRIEPVGSLDGGTVEVSADAVTFEIVNPDGALVRVRYEAAEAVWSEQFSR